MSRRGPTLDPNDRIPLKFMPADYRGAAEIQTMIGNGGAINQGTIDAINNSVNTLALTTEWLWHTTIGGVPEHLGGVRDDVNGTWPAHPVTNRSLLFDNPNLNKKPLPNGNHISGGGELDPRLDHWAGAG